VNTTNTNIPTTTVKKNRRTLLLLIAISVLPIVSAYYLIKSGWRPATTGNYGELVQPAKPIESIDIVRYDVKFSRSESIEFSDFRRKWSLVYFGEANCPQACQDSLYKMKQIQQSVKTKHHDRIQRIFILTHSKSASALPDSVTQDYKLQVITGPGKSLANLDKQFTLSFGSPRSGLNRIYIVDPLGNLMMSYPVDADPSKMRKDLSRLLKVSHVG